MHIARLCARGPADDRAPELGILGARALARAAQVAMVHGDLGARGLAPLRAEIAQAAPARALDPVADATVHSAALVWRCWNPRGAAARACRASGMAAIPGRWSLRRNGLRRHPNASGWGRLVAEQARNGAGDRGRHCLVAEADHRPMLARDW